MMKTLLSFLSLMFSANFVCNAQKRLSQNRVEMASFVSSPIEVIWIFLKKGVYKLTFEGFILSNFFFRCHKPPKRLLLQDYVQWPAGRTQFQPS